MILTAFNAVCILMNIAHIVVLQSITSLKGKPYLSILRVMACSDITYSISAIFSYDCHIREMVLASTLPGLWSLIIGVFRSMTILFQNIPACLSSIERYIAVCRPYSTSHLIHHFGKLAALHVIIFLMISFVIHWLSFNDICFDAMAGPRFELTNGAAMTGIITLWAPMLTVVILSTMVLLEIRRMNRRAQAIQDSELKRASHFIIATNAIFYTLMCPTSTIMPLAFIAGGGSLPHADWVMLEWFIVYAHTFYGVANILLYAIMFKSYRQHFKKVFGIISSGPSIAARSVQVVPANSTTRQNS